MVRTLHCHYRGSKFHSLVGELRSSKLGGLAKKKTKQRRMDKLTLKLLLKKKKLTTVPDTKKILNQF